MTVRLTPRGGRDRIDGIQALADGTSALKARVRAPASEGEANAALLGLLAGVLALPLRDVGLVAGATARLKQVRISGAAPTLAAALEKICAIS